MIEPDSTSSNISFTDGSKQNIDIVELRRLLTDILDKRPDIAVRYRLIGQLWQNSFFPVRRLTDKEVIFLNIGQQVFTKVLISDITQIEIDGSFQGYRPNFHYTVKVALK